MLFSRAKQIDYSTFQISTLNGTVIERVPHYKNLDIWIDVKFTIKVHVDNLVKKNADETWL